MEAVFNTAKTGPIEFQPLSGIELFGRGAGQEANVFILAALGLAQQAGRLRRQGKTHLLRAHRLGADRAADALALFVVEGTILRRRQLPRGGNPLWGRELISGAAGAASVGYL